MNMSVARVSKDFWQNMENQFMVTSKASTKEKLDGIYAYSREKWKVRIPKS